MSPTASPIRIGVTDAAMIHEVQDSEVLLSGVEPVDIRALDRIADFFVEDRGSREAGQRTVLLRMRRKLSAGDILAHK